MVRDCAGRGPHCVRAPIDVDADNAKRWTGLAVRIEKIQCRTARVPLSPYRTRRAVRDRKEFETRTELMRHVARRLV